MSDRTPVADMSPGLVHRVRTLVHDLAVKELGGAEVAAPIGDTRVMRRALVDPLVGVRTALQVRDVAAVAAESAAVEARAAGASWAQVGAALCLSSAGRGDRSSVELSAELARRAFDLVALAWSMDRPELAGYAARRVLWTYRTCLRVVTDFGPDELTPDERESGHAWSCARRRAELAADDDERDETTGGAW